jgi:hypothetical protein
MYRAITRPLFLAVQFLMWLVFGLWGQVSRGAAVNPAWHLETDTAQIAALWAYDTACAKVAPLPGHDWRAIEWYTAPVTEQDREHLVLAYWTVDTAITFSNIDLADNVHHTLSVTYTVHDVIVIDTAVILWPSALRHRIIAHEMIHQLIHGRVIPNPAADDSITLAGGATTIGPRTAEVQDPVHPFFIFGGRCNLMAGPALGDTVPEILEPKP